MTKALRSQGALRAIKQSLEDNLLLISENVTIAKQSNRIFVVHGHDHGTKETVARFLSRLGLDPVILHEKPNLGRTVIEKFHHYAGVGFAVVLLTADDTGKPRSAKVTGKPRARQNVVFELGYFIGKLGRAKVCALYEHNVELPSDMQGVIYIPLDPVETWQNQLIRELTASGFKIDTNRLFKD